MLKHLGSFKGIFTVKMGLQIRYHTVSYIQCNIDIETKSYGVIHSLDLRPCSEHILYGEASVKMAGCPWPSSHRLDDQDGQQRRLQRLL